MIKKSVLKKRMKCIVKIAVAIFVCGSICLSPVVNAAASGSANREGLEDEIAQAEEQLNQAKEAQADAESRYMQGSLGFINWMLEKDDLTDLQRYDLDKAKAVILAACEESFLNWVGGDNTGLPERRNNMVTVLNDRYDAISISNLEASFSVLNNINTIRAEDKNYVGSMKRNAARTNFYFMAVAQTGADRGAGLKRHSSLVVSCENLSFGASNPAYLWNTEISAFNKVKDSLAISTLENEEDVAEIEEAAEAQNMTVGHYTNLFYDANQVMGIGYTNYSGTCCYNAGRLSDYASKYATYTISEFKALFDEYFDTINPELYQADVDAAQVKLDGLLEEYYSYCTHSFDAGVEVPAGCKKEGGTIYTCTICGFSKKENVTNALGHDFLEGICTRCGMTGPKNIKSIKWWYVSGSSMISNTTSNQTYEIGADISVDISYTTASEYKGDDEFIFDIGNPDILLYEPSTNSSGTMHMLGIGETTVTIYPAENPSMAKSFHVSVTDVGGHDFVIEEAEEGADTTTKICTKCGFSKEITIPTEINRIYWLDDAYWTYTPEQYEQGDVVKIQLTYLPQTVDNDAFTVEISDLSVATFTAYTPGDKCLGELNMIGQGDVTVTIYATYNPSVKKTYRFNVSEPGGHDFSAKIVNEETLKKAVDCEHEAEYYYSCVNCGRVDNADDASTFTSGEPLGHAYVPTYKWSSDYSSCILNITCKNDSTHTFEGPAHVSVTEIPATCTTEGKKIYKINYMYYYVVYTSTREVSVEALGHSWDNGVITKEATSTEPGEKTYTCTVCKTTYTEKISGTEAPAVGKKIKDSKGNTYKVTKSGTSGGTVEYSKSKGTSNTVTIPATVKIAGITYQVTSIAPNAFQNNKKITRVTVGNHVKVIGKNAFRGCTKLKSVKLGKNVTTIGDYAFYKCTGLTKMTIPSKVNKIGKSAFRNCKKLKRITMNTTRLKTKNVGSSAFRGINNKAVIKVPAKKKKAYTTILKKKGISGKKYIRIL